MWSYVCWLLSCGYLSAYCCHVVICLLIAVMWWSVCWLLSCAHLSDDCCHVVICLMIAVMWSSVCWLLSCGRVSSDFCHVVVCLLIAVMWSSFVCPVSCLGVRLNCLSIFLHMCLVYNIHFSPPLPPTEQSPPPTEPSPPPFILFKHFLSFVLHTLRLLYVFIYLLSYHSHVLLWYTLLLHNYNNNNIHCHYIILLPYNIFSPLLSTCSVPFLPFLSSTRCTVFLSLIHSVWSVILLNTPWFVISITCRWYTHVCVLCVYSVLLPLPFPPLLYLFLLFLCVCDCVWWYVCSSCWPDGCNQLCQLDNTLNVQYT